MNDILKLLSKSLRPFGYHVRKYKAPNILRLPALERTEQDASALNLPKVTGNGFFPKDSDLASMVIFVRTCIRENRNIDKTKRVTKVTLEENTKRCLFSLLKSISHAQESNKNRIIKLICLDDHSDEPFRQALENIIAKAPCEHEFRKTSDTGQGKSLHEQFQLGSKENALVYFCEDDYLHEIDAIDACWNFYERIAHELETHSVIYPQEHAALYSDHYPSYILLGEDRKWRTIRHATHTFITHGKVVEKFWPFFENTKFVGDRKNRKKGSEAYTTNQLFEKIPGFSPMVPAAVHLQFEETLPPLYDWKSLWESNKTL
ncbi:MAG: glycosyltransferase [Alphaproteobacteria bacterium]